MSEDRINKLEKNIEALTDLILKMHEKKEEPKIEVKQEEIKIDAYQAKLQEEERIKHIREQERKKLLFEDKIKNFNKLYAIDETVCNRVDSLVNESTEYKATILLEEKFKDGNFINSLSSNLKTKINNYLGLNIDSKKQEASNMIEVLDEAEEQFNKLEEVKYKHASNNVVNQNKTGIDLMFLATNKFNKKQEVK